METQSSELAIYSDKNIEKAWHLASVILCIGRPATTAELAGKCSMLHVSSEFVEFLCSVPNSPLFLTGDGFVFPSLMVFGAVGEFLSSSIPKFLQIGVRCGARMFCRNVYFRKRKKLGNEVTVMLKKRAVLRSVHENDMEITRLHSAERILSSSFKVVDLQDAHAGSAVNALPFGMSMNKVDLEIFSEIMAVMPSVVNSNIGLLGYELMNDEDKGSGNKQNTAVVDEVHKSANTGEHQDRCYSDNGTILDMPIIDKEATHRESLAEISATSRGDKLDWPQLKSRMVAGAPSCTEIDLNKPPSMEAAAAINSSGDRVEVFPFGSCRDDSPPRTKLCQTNMQTSNGRMRNLNEPLNITGRTQPLVSADPSVTQKSRTNISSMMKNAPKGELTQKKKTPSKSLQHSKVDIHQKEFRGQKDRITNAMKNKSKQIVRNNVLIEEKCDDAQKSSQDKREPKLFPEFDSYTVEEEEGSGGYGTVYKARRKSDGLTFAIKYPHSKAHKHHVKNEMKMLERFGGRNFVIKYEGCFKEKDSDCFVLEHVEHDRPEQVLKREINIYQLQWYGYCMFKALASLHKQGVFHRDVKPGNFLFSCKTNKGYLIDFNLAKDLHQKHGNIDKSVAGYVKSIQHIPAPQSESVTANKRRKIIRGKSPEAFKAGAESGLNRSLESKTLKKTLEKLKAYDELSRRHSVTSQGADGSGLTSAKDMTSTRTASADRLREPLPCQGRKELINLAQEAMQCTNVGAAASGPASNRKRIAASPGVMDRNLFYPTPMPLHSSGIALCGAAASLKNRGEVKPNKEGPCVGTKGFRAPEVLLRSLHQGPKIDVWSAGVTLLYLMSGRMPFTGDPEQNMKDIVKLKGNEELWEVAKLHNCESSFSVDLLDMRYLAAVKIKEWCVANTKRPDFVEIIPESLFDLIEKCMLVNPRMRITAEEALRHEFFAPCHEALHKQRLLRQGPRQDSVTVSKSY